MSNREKYIQQIKNRLISRRNARKLNNFRDLMFNSLGKSCVDPFCTTCGSQKFKKALDKFSKEEIIEGLKLIPEEYLHLRDSSDALLSCFYKASLFGTLSDLVEPLKGSPAGDELEFFLKNTKFIRND
jgi:hypothetical protein